MGISHEGIFGAIPQVVAELVPAFFNRNQSSRSYALRQFDIRLKS